MGGGPIAISSRSCPALPIIAIFAAIGRYLIEESDEYLRLLTVRQTLVASGFALSLATAWGFLESFDLAAHVDAYWIAVVWFGGLGLGPASTDPGREAGVKNRLKALRAERGWSQVDLADRLEVSRQSVIAIETGRYDPPCPSPSRSRSCSASPSKTFSPLLPRNPKS
jgi:hypothetical protein